jgi:PAS domain S-box-containing protein
MFSPQLSNDNVLELIGQLYKEVTVRSVENENYRPIEEKLEATLHELNLYQEELSTQSESLKNAVQELDFLYHKYAHLFDFAPIGYFTFDSSGLVTEANLTGANILGADRGRLIGKPMMLFLSRATRNAFFSHLRAVFSGMHGSVEVELIDRNGEHLPYVIKSTPIRDNGGHIVFCRSAALDISDRKRAEQALKAANDHLEERVRERTAELVKTNNSLRSEVEKRKGVEKELSQEKEILDITLRGIGDGIIASDVAGRIILINEVAERLTGWKHGDARGRDLAEVFDVIDTSCRSTKKNSVDQAFGTGKKIELGNHTILKQRGGPERIIENGRIPIMGKDGEMTGGILVIRDVTEERELEEEQQRATKLEAIGFLTAIIGNISLANMVNENRVPEITEILGKAESACTKAKALTGQLLTFAKGGKPVKKVRDIRSLLRESSEFIARGKGAQLKFDIAEDLYLVEVDDGQLNQVMNNLVINAIQATEKKKDPTIRVMADNFFNQRMGKVPLKRGKYVRITVTDNGHGIKKENIEKIFDPYFTTKQFSSQKGCGLGLSSTYSIVKHHGGHISVDSTPGKGTTFSFYLPVSRKKAPDKPVISNGKTKAWNRMSSEKRGRILVMDDEEIIRDLSVEFLTLLGHTVETAPDGEEALRVYGKAARARRPFDAVIMDLTIPGGLGGKEAIKQLRKLDPHARAIVSSGYSHDPVMAEYENHGFDAVIAKPFRIEDLREVVERVLSVPRPCKQLPQVHEAELVPT